MVWVPRTLKVWVTELAAAHVMLSPGWLAVMEHVPEEASVIAVPETVQMEVLLEIYETVRPEVAVAPRTGGVVPRV